MRIAKGLKATYKNAKELTVEETVAELTLRTDCYEVLNDGFNRLYFDIDGVAPSVCSPSEFEALRTGTLAVLDSLTSEPIAIMEASKYESRKISFRVVVPSIRATKKDAKLIAESLRTTVCFPEGVRIDLAPYGANQKMRMLGQNKDGENRPLVLVRGQVTDTFISVVPETCRDAVVPVPEKPKPKGRPRKLLENTLIGDILAMLDIKRLDDYEMWMNIGFICFNEGQALGVWENASLRSAKHTSGTCESKWKTFTKGHIGIAKLWGWLKEDNPEAYDRLKEQDYAFRKEVFELTHVKLRNPCRFLRLSDDSTTQLLGVPELRHIYGSEVCGGKSFIDQWINDPSIYTCERMEFKPKQEATPGYYNLWTDFALSPEEGDWSPVAELLWDLSGHKEDILEYFLNYFAHLFQKPFDKPGVMILLSSPNEGIGKDTLGDAVIGPILGDKYYVSTTNHEDEVFGRFTSQLRTTLFLKMEEMDRDCCHKNNDKLKGLITCDKRDYEEKGLPKGFPIKSYVRVFGTTNDPCPVVLTSDFRRYLLVNPSADHVNDRVYWKEMYRRLGYEGATLRNSSVQSAFLHACLARDIEGWNPRTRCETSALASARQSQAPPHARWFQTQLCQRMDETGELEESDELRASFTYFKEHINRIAKFPYTDYKLREELRLYPQVVPPRHTRGGTEWVFNSRIVKAFLLARNWWVPDT